MTTMPKQSGSASKTGAGTPMADCVNRLPLDDAPQIPIGPGVTGRYGLCPVAALLPNPHRVQTHSPRQLEKLGRSLAISGQLSPTIVDESFCILAGHARLEAAKRAGAAQLSVVQVFGLSDAQKRQYLLADNRVGSDARLDRKALADQLPDLTILFADAGFELADTGFEVADLDELVLDFGDLEADPTDEVDSDIANEPLILRAGDLLSMGGHRLIVGDARYEATLDQLMAGEQAEAAFLDVPYNVSVRSIGGRGRHKHPEFDFASGEMTRAEFVPFLTTALGNAARVSAANAVHFVCIDWKHVRDLVEAAENAYAAYLNLVVWNKTNAGQGGLYRNQHELIGVFRVGDEPHRDNIQKGIFGRNRSNVWTYAGANTFRSGRLQDLADHPTVKPTALVADALRDVTRRDAAVLDSFVGSGTTVLAGEKVGRRVRAVEINPRYAQIATRRWEVMTGKEAVHVESGLTLVELAQGRGAGQVPLEAVAVPPVPESAVAVAAPRARVRTRSVS